MKYLKAYLIILAAGTTLLLTGCSDEPYPLTENSFVYNGNNFGEYRNEDFKQGVKDGCETSDGRYKKNHALFQNSNSYHVGWEDGRLNCNIKKEEGKNE